VIGADFDTVLAAAQKGGECAFAALYRDLNPRLLRYFASRAPGLADDLASDTWMAAANGLRGFTGGEGAFRGWVFTIARHSLVQHWRDCNRRPSTPMSPEALATHEGKDDPATTALEALSTVHAARAIAAALPAAQAEVVLLRVLGGLDVDQVAGIMGKRPGTVRVLQHRALRRLAGTFSLEDVTA
jgi:RNA polymerase sigma-70 factor (ECF subfamily)